MITNDKQKKRTDGRTDERLLNGQKMDENRETESLDSFDHRFGLIRLLKTIQTIFNIKITVFQIQIILFLF